MILIQTILIIGFAIFLYRVLANPASYRLRAWTKLFAAIFVLIAVTAVLIPGITNKLARFVGVTRGADLLLYLLTLAFIFTILSNYVQEKKSQQRIVLLARRIAINEANLRNIEDVAHKA